MPKIDDFASKTGSDLPCEKIRSQLRFVIDKEKSSWQVPDQGTPRPCRIQLEEVYNPSLQATPPGKVVREAPGRSGMRRRRQAVIDSAFEIFLGGPTPQAWWCFIVRWTSHMQCKRSGTIG